MNIQQFFKQGMDRGDLILQTIRENPGKTCSQYKSLLSHIPEGTVSAECTGAVRYRFAKKQGIIYYPTDKKGLMGEWESKARKAMREVSDSTRERFMLGYFARIEEFDSIPDDQPERKAELAQEFFLEMELIIKGKM